MLSRTPSRGFTLIELITVMVLVGILAAVALPRIDFEGFDQRAYARELAVVLRHAQKVAAVTRCPVQVNVSAIGYSVAYAGGSCGTSILPHPSRNGSLTGSGSATTGGSVTFDGWGHSNSGLTIQLAGGHSIQVYPGSGYVEN